MILPAQKTRKLKRMARMLKEASKGCNSPVRINVPTATRISRRLEISKAMGALPELASLLIG
jgi:hypothetical protein